MLERQRVPVNSGKVEWSGDNPGIYLKTDPDGDWTSLAVYFRIALSPHGRGRAMMILEEPDRASGFPDAVNVCITDNVPMTNYLLDGFLSKFPTFRGRPGLASMTTLAMTGAETTGDFEGDYAEVMTADGLEAKMVWRGLGGPFPVEVSPAECATGEHDMYSMFLEAGGAEILINGRAIDGSVVKRPFFGISMSSAFLAFSETWVTPA